MKMTTRLPGMRTMVPPIPHFPQLQFLPAQMALGQFSFIDIDNDGDMDIVSASEQDDKIAWYENNGADHPHFPQL